MTHLLFNVNAFECVCGIRLNPHFQFVSLSLNFRKPSVTHWRRQLCRLNFGNMRKPLLGQNVVSCSFSGSRKIGLSHPMCHSAVDFGKWHQICFSKNQITTRLLRQWAHNDAMPAYVWWFGPIEMSERDLHVLEHASLNGPWVKSLIHSQVLTVDPHQKAFENVIFSNSISISKRKKISNLNKILKTLRHFQFRKLRRADMTGKQ